MVELQLPVPAAIHQTPVSEPADIDSLLPSMTLQLSEQQPAKAGEFMMRSSPLSFLHRQDTFNPKETHAWTKVPVSAGKLGVLDSESGAFEVTVTSSWAWSSLEVDNIEDGVKAIDGITWQSSHAVVDIESEPEESA